MPQQVKMNGMFLSDKIIIMGKLTVREEDGGKANCERRRWYEGWSIMKTNFDHQKKRKSPRGKSSNFQVEENYQFSKAREEMI